MSGTLTYFKATKSTCSFCLCKSASARRQMDACPPAATLRIAQVRDTPAFTACPGLPRRWGLHRSDLNLGPCPRHPQDRGPTPCPLGRWDLCL